MFSRTSSQLVKAISTRPAFQAAAAQAAQPKRPHVITRALPEDMGTLFIGAEDDLTNALPGNGGMRIKSYKNDEDASKEALALAQGMAAKHAAYNTGFAGAKVVVNLPEFSNKDVALDSAAALLNEMNGSMYTGCDIGTGDADMHKLLEDCPYILAAMGHSVDPNVSTASGVFGALESVMGGSVAGKRILIHGTGKVGAPLAQMCLDNGADKVYVCDLAAEDADIEGCINVNRMEEPWWTIEVDAFCPCSCSGLVDPLIAQELKTKAICGATNILFSEPAAYDIINERGIVFVPEAVSSAGAIIVDSIEFWDRNEFLNAEPQTLYNFCRSLCSEKTNQLNRECESSGLNSMAALADISHRNQKKMGEQFATWNKGGSIVF